MSVYQPACLGGEAVISDINRPDSLRPQDALSGRDDAYHFPSPGFHNQIGSADTQTQSEYEPVSWGIRRSAAPFKQQAPRADHSIKARQGQEIHVFR